MCASWKRARSRCAPSYVARQEEIAKLSARVREAERNLVQRGKQIAELTRAAELARQEDSAAAAHAANINMTVVELEEEIAGHKARHTADASRILRLEGECDGLRRQLEDLRAARPNEAPRPRTPPPIRPFRRWRR